MGGSVGITRKMPDFMTRIYGNEITIVLGN